MLALKCLLMIAGLVLFGSSAALVAYDIYLSEQLRRLLARSKSTQTSAGMATTAQRPFGPVRYQLVERPALIAVVPTLSSLSIGGVADGFAVCASAGQVQHRLHGSRAIEIRTDRSAHKIPGAAVPS